MTTTTAGNWQDDTAEIYRPFGYRTPDPAAAARPASTKLRLAYLTTEYPKVSHTFVRREIAELERRGHEVVRLSVRPPGGPLVDPADRAEAERTLFCLDRPKLTLLAHSAKWAATRPGRWASAVRATLRLHAKSDRGLVRHAAYLAEAAFLANRLKAQGIGHVHCHFGTNAAAVALLMNKLSGVTYSLTIHGPGEFDAPVGLSLAEKVAGAAFTAAISHFGTAQLLRWVDPQHWDRIHVVRCTINPDFLAPPEPVAADADRLVCVGRLTPQKGQLHLVDAFAGLVKAGYPGRLVLAGDGELRPALEASIRGHCIGDRVEITGWLSEAGVRREIGRSRAMVLPSSAEGLPVVLMEALAMGRPCVSTFTAGIPELIRPGESGWLVSAGDAAALSDALREVMSTPPARLTQMGLAGRARVELRHHPVTEGDTLEALFRRYVTA